MQTNWLSKYIERNTAMRKQAKSPSGKTFYKMTLNACFDKTIENKKNWLNAKFVHFITNDQEAMKLTSKPTFIF